MTDQKVFEIDYDTLTKDIERQIDNFQKWSKSDKSKTTTVTIASGLASAVTTVAIGLVKFVPDGFSDPLQALALIVSASVTVLLTWDRLFQHKSLWLQNARARRKFLALRDDLKHANATNSVNQELLKISYSEYKAILEERNSAWEKMRSAE